MSQTELVKVLLSPKITEKTVAQSGEATMVVFKVIPGASKPTIKKAVELMFEVEVASVRTLNSKGKSRRFGKVQGHTKAWKKAYVTLKPGHDIQFAEGELG